ncbi:HAD hydrolase-like protein [Bacillus sp. MCCB 382]|uniref:HAD hydrolase-like protein n=1 Tax=Bacillus sp. MCCB 382 TaxID=2860197 RepID=UPI001C59794C|nr:HAD hydrolase-like protein [Bacillus sp. MCCB 382]
MKAAMIFDLDGTLFQTHLILEDALHDAFLSLRDEGIWTGEVPVFSYRELMAGSFASMCAHLLPDDKVMQNKVNERFQAKLQQNALNGKGDLFTHAEELLTYLADMGSLIIVISNSSTQYIQTIVEHYSLDRWVSSIYSMQDMETNNKGDAIRRVKEDHDLTHGVVIGDRIQDFKGAEENHFLSIGCAFGFSEEQELLEADIVVEDLMEIKTYLEKVK